MKPDKRLADFAASLRTPPDELSVPLATAESLLDLLRHVAGIDAALRSLRADPNNPIDASDMAVLRHLSSDLVCLLDDRVPPDVQDEARCLSGCPVTVRRRMHERGQEVPAWIEDAIRKEMAAIRRLRPVASPA